MKLCSRELVVLTIGAIVLLGGNAFAVPVVDGTFGLGEWSGYYAAEDGVGNGGYVGPGYGGQAFDVEYLGLCITGNTVHFGLQTGFDVVNGAQGFDPGDFVIDANADGTFDYAVDFSFGAGGLTYTLYENPVWQDVQYPQHSDANPFQNIGGDAVSALFDSAYGAGIFPNNIDGGISYVLEGSFDLSALDLYTGGEMILQWTMECGNDYLQVKAVALPEPTSMALCCAGLLGIFAARRRIRK